MQAIACLVSIIFDTESLGMAIRSAHRKLSRSGIDGESQETSRARGRSRVGGRGKSRRGRGQRTGVDDERAVGGGADLVPHQNFVVHSITELWLHSTLADFCWSFTHASIPAAV